MRYKLIIGMKEKREISRESNSYHNIGKPKIG